MDGPVIHDKVHEWNSQPLLERKVRHKKRHTLLTTVTEAMMCHTTGKSVFALLKARCSLQDQCSASLIYYRAGTGKLIYTAVGRYDHRLVLCSLFIQRVQ
jgi:hypothetical protein